MKDNFLDRVLLLTFSFLLSRPTFCIVLAVGLIVFCLLISFAEIHIFQFDTDLPVITKLYILGRLNSSSSSFLLSACKKWSVSSVAGTAGSLRSACSHLSFEALVNCLSLPGLRLLCFFAWEFPSWKCFVFLRTVTSISDFVKTFSFGYF